ncbi:MAG: hypothetical protein PHN63_04990 [Candidatus Omnitrophica bacterium]|nr:hypothetical protein [Candidatus Omnitrophota bacterium]
MALCLLAVIVVGFASIEVFSRTNVLIADRRAKLQNDAALVLEHITSSGIEAIGNAAYDPAVMRYTNVNGIRIRIDSNANGMVDAGDTWVGYCNGTGANNTRVLFYPNATTSDPPSGSSDLLTDKLEPGGLIFSSWVNITGIVPPDTGFHPATGILQDTKFDATVSVRWNPTSTTTTDNPEVNLTTTVQMPSVAKN